MTAALGLFRLQQVDRQIDQHSARMAAIRQVLENDLELRQALSHVDEAGHKQAEAEATLREAEAMGSAQQIKIEQALMKLFPRDDWALLSHLLIFHGRRVCIARRPKCGECVLADLCPSARLP